MPALTIRTGLIAVSLATLALSGGVGYVAMTSAETLSSGASRFYDDILPGLEAAAGMNSALGDVRLAEAGYLTIADPGQIDGVQAKVTAATEAFDAWVIKYAETIPDDAEAERGDFDAIELAFMKYLAMSERVAEHAAASEMAQASSLYLIDMDATYTALGETLDKLVAHVGGDG